MSLFENTAFSTVKRMFQDRGYTKTKEKSVPKDSKNPYRVLQAKDKNNRRVCYFVDVCEKLNNEKIKMYVALLNELDASHCIVAYVEKTHVVDETLKSLKISDQIKFEIFNIKNLQYIVVDHVLQPKFSLFPKTELGRIAPKNLPEMLKTDPVARYYDYESGSVIQEISRDNIITFRVVK